MEVCFSNKDLESLYTTGVCEKYELNKEEIHDFTWLICVISAAKDISDLDGQPALGFKKTNNKYSLKLSKKHRLEIGIEWEIKEKTVRIIFIKEIIKIKGC